MSLRSLFCLFLSGRFTKKITYTGYNDLSYIRRTLIYVGPRSRKVDSFISDFVFVPINESVTMDTRSCLEEEKQFNGTFQDNLNKLNSLRFPEADEWIDRLGLNKERAREVPSLPVLATAASSGFFDVSQGLIKSVHEKLLPRYPGLKLIYYDLGLTNDQRKKVIVYIYVYKISPSAISPKFTRPHYLYRLRRIADILNKSENATLQSSIFCEKVLGKKFLLKLNNVSQTFSKR